MIRVATRNEIDEVLQYLEQDLQLCLYAYIDIKKYRIDNPNLTVYVQYDGKDNLQCVVMKYYKGLQIYTHKEEYDAKELVSFLKGIEFNMINGSDYLVSAIQRELKGVLDTECETGYVMELTDFIWQEDKDVSSLIEYVPDERYDEVARLICSDEELGGHYEVEALSRQLLERKNEQFGRNLILCVDGKIACHGATYAEIEEAAVVSGIITDADCRGKGYAYQVVGKLCRDLRSEGKRVFLFYYNDTAGRLYKKLGFGNEKLRMKLTLR